MHKTSNSLTYLPAKWILKPLKTSQRQLRLSGGQTLGGPVGTLANLELEGGGWEGRRAHSSSLPAACVTGKTEALFFLMTQQWTVGVGKEPPKIFWEHLGAGWRRRAGRWDGRGDENKQHNKSQRVVCAGVFCLFFFFSFFVFYFFFKSHLWSTEAATVLGSINQLVTGSDFIGG